jgi:hypothetical protein
MNAHRTVLLCCQNQPLSIFYQLYPLDLLQFDIVLLYLCSRIRLISPRLQLLKLNLTLVPSSLASCDNYCVVQLC